MIDHTCNPMSHSADAHTCQRAHRRCRLRDELSTPGRTDFRPEARKRRSMRYRLTSALAQQFENRVTVNPSRRSRRPESWLASALAFERTLSILDPLDLPDDL